MDIHKLQVLSYPYFCADIKNTDTCYKQIFIYNIHLLSIVDFIWKCLDVNTSYLDYEKYGRQSEAKSSRVFM